MPTREQNAFQRLKLRIANPRDRFERIENGLGTGTPDVNYLLKFGESGAEGWIEIKAPKLPARLETTRLLGNDHPLSPDQANWFLKQHRAGGRGWLFVATEVQLLLLPGGTVAQQGIALNELPLPELAMLSVWRADVPVRSTGPWGEMRMLLTGEAM